MRISVCLLVRLSVYPLT